MLRRNQQTKLLIHFYKHFFKKNVVIKMANVQRIDDYLGHAMVQIGNTKISLKKAVLCAQNAPEILAMNIAQNEQGRKNPFM